MNESYSKIWRWHFFAGLFLSPTLITLAVTGLIYLFKPQIEPVIYKKWLDVPAEQRVVSAQQQLDSALQSNPGSRLQYVTPSSGPGKSMQVFLKSKDEGPRIVYVNPHDGSIVGSQRSDRTLMQLAHDIHGTLLLGKPGEIIMELTAGWAFILVATGLFLWWPKNKNGYAGILWPRFSLTGRGFWKDIHAVPAFYLSALIFLFLATGVPWTGITGKLLGRIGQATGTGSPPGFGGSPFKSEILPGQTPLPLDRLVEISRERLPGAPAQIILPKDPSSAAVIRWKAPRPQDRAYIHVDMGTGKVIADYRWKDFGFIGKFVLMAVALHEGTWFGVWNQILNSLVALGVFGLAVTGLMMWWKRRPTGALLAAPQPSANARFPGGLIALIGLFCVMVPIAGLSLFAILLIDALVKKTKFIFHRESNS
ncbi:MAG: hypothetical protein KCHDKBKB_02569 [Elusimicrobia bacterium]|nr:hypothetical protein [Elusimicrobiota bacterium]